jgi:pimeloyl-ACP methyl ester carboxylesterase
MPSEKPQRELRAEVPAGSITAWQAGTGPDVLILHGGPGLSDYTAPLAAEFEHAFRVIRYQQRGLPPSVTSGPFDVDRHVADAVAVLDAAGADQAYVVGHSWGGHLAMHLAVQHPDRLLGLVVVDPLGAVPDGGAGDMERNLAARIPPERAARARELDEKAMAGHGTAEDALEGLAIVWPGYFAKPDQAPAMPPLGLSVECYAGTFGSILWHFEHKTLEQQLPSLRVPTVLVLGADSPIPPEHGIATAALIPGAQYRIEPGCGHFTWLERPGSVRAALASIAGETRAGLAGIWLTAAVSWVGRQDRAPAQGLEEDVLVRPGGWMSAVLLLGPGGPAADEFGVVP